jgi:hypothetical protein
MQCKGGRNGYMVETIVNDDIINTKSKSPFSYAFFSFHVEVLKSGNKMALNVHYYDIESIIIYNICKVEHILWFFLIVKVVIYVDNIAIKNRISHSSIKVNND